MMPLQRACGAESQVRNKLSNGPLRAQSKAHLCRVFCDVLTYVSCRECVGTLLSAQGRSCESRWHRGYGQVIYLQLFVLGRILFL